MTDRLSAADLRVGATVRAFHPGMFGVIRDGVVVTYGPKWVHVDFGPLNGGTYRVRYDDVTVVTG